MKEKRILNILFIFHKLNLNIDCIFSTFAYMLLQFLVFVSAVSTGTGSGQGVIRTPSATFTATSKIIRLFGNSYIR